MTDKDWKKLKTTIETLEKEARCVLKIDEVSLHDRECRHPYFHVKCSWYEMQDLENAWMELGNVPISSDDRLEDDFDVMVDVSRTRFEKGTKLEDVWKWFDDHHPFGVKYLMYGVRDASKEAT